MSSANASTHLSVLLKSDETIDKIYRVAYGYRHDEETINLIEIERDEDAPADGYSLGFHKKDFTQQDAKALWREARTLKLADELLTPKLPLLNVEKPADSEWRDVPIQAMPILLQQYQGDYLVERDSDGKTSFKQTLFYTATEYPQISEVLDLNVSDELKKHLDNGYCAYVHISGFTVQWLPIPNYLAKKRWQVYADEYQENLDKWKTVIKNVDIKKGFDAALLQKQKLSVLPFEWKADSLPADCTERMNGDVRVHLVTGANVMAQDYRWVSTPYSWRADSTPLYTHHNEDSHGKQTLALLTHLMLAQDYNDGITSFKEGDLLCTVSKSPNNHNQHQGMHDSEDTLVCYQDGCIVQKIQRVIDCQACLDLIEQYKQ